MKTIDDINLHTWFMERELEFKPAHFIESSVPVTEESKVWILEKLTGRFTLGPGAVTFYNGMFPSFEDSKEALFYELTWG
jgi:hypothetical protein